MSTTDLTPDQFNNATIPMTLADGRVVAFPVSYLPDLLAGYEADAEPYTVQVISDPNPVPTVEPDHA